MKKLLLLIFTLLFISTAIVFSSFTKTNQKTNTDDLPQLVIEGKKFGLRDSKTGKLITEIKYDYIGLPNFKDSGLGDDKNYWFENGYEAIFLNGKWGVIDKNGKEVVVPTYEEMSNYSEGLVAVKKGEKWAFMSMLGNFITDFDYLKVGEFYEGRAMVGKYFLIQKENKVDDEWGTTSYQDTLKYGFINLKGKEVVPLIYDEVFRFSEGLALVGKREFVKEKIKVFSYDKIVKNDSEEMEILGKTLIEGKTLYTIQDLQEVDSLYERMVYYIIDRNNDSVFKIPYEINARYNRFENGLLEVKYEDYFYKKYKDDTKFSITYYRSAIFNKEGKDLTSDKYHNVRLYQGTNSTIRVENSNKKVYDSDSTAIGLLDRNGKEIIALGKYEEIIPVLYKGEEVFAAKKYYEQVFYIFNIKGNIIAEVNERNNLVKTTDKNGVYTFLEQHPKQGVNKTGKELYPVKYEKIYFARNDGQYEVVPIKLNDKYALGNSEGKILSDFVYDKLDWTYQNCFKATIEEQEFYINNQNECIGNCPDNSFLKKHNIKQAKIKN